MAVIGPLEGWAAGSVRLTNELSAKPAFKSKLRNYYVAEDDSYRGNNSNHNERIKIELFSYRYVY